MSTTEAKLNPNDMPKTLTVKVTQDHIDRGKMSNSCCCPIALAVSEQYRQAVSVSGTLKLYDVGTRTNIIPDYFMTINYLHQTSKVIDMYSMSASAFHFINRFDAGEAVNPSTFTFKYERRVS